MRHNKPLNKKSIRRGNTQIIKHPRRDGRGYRGETRLQWNERGTHVDVWEQEEYGDGDGRAARGSISFFTVLAIIVFIVGIIGIIAMYIPQ